jgi:phosphatidylserine/phosphatidylglycerophosphate/cardiolipin synthase-like enzyme
VRARMKCLALVAVVLAACSSENAADDQPAPDAAPDASDGIGCTTTSPRTTPPEAFVGPDGLQDRISALIDSAQSSLDLQMYLFTVRPLADKIVAAKQRGVTVRVILDPDEAGNLNVTPTLTNGGIDWKNASTIYTFAHAKYLLVDHATAVIMSMNFNLDAMDKERNYGMVDTDAEDVADLQAIFEQDWALANGHDAAAPDLSCTRLIVSPVNANARLLAFINSATTTLDVEVLYITDATVRNAIGAAKQRGVNVRVILEDPSDQNTNADTTTYLKNLNIPVKYADNQFYLHAKLIIADGVAFVGSQNFSPTALTHNREVGALVFEPASEAVIEQQFEADWAITTAAP